MREEMSNGEVRNVSRQDIQLVQNLIERCLQLYMNQKEVVDTLLYQAKIEPGFTELVWQKLEEENPDFFKGYHVRLLLKRQMGVFNKLLERQVKLMHEVCPPGAASAPHSNVEQTPSCYISDCSPIPSGHDNMFCKGGSSSAMMNDDCSGNQCNQLDNAILNGDSSGNQSIQLNNDASNLAGMVDVSPCFLSTQNSHMEMANVINGTMNKSEPSYSDNSDFFCADGSFLDLGIPMGIEPDASVSSSELTLQPVNESLVDIDSSSFGFLSRIPRNFSFSDLTNDFTQSADILENYGKSPFLGAEANNFSDSSQRDFDERR